jgi:hypothetical protein
MSGFVTVDNSILAMDISLQCPKYICWAQDGDLRQTTMNLSIEGFMFCPLAAGTLESLSKGQCYKGNDV